MIWWQGLAKMDSTPPFSTTRIAGQFEPDQGPGKHRIGLIVLSNDYVTERDFVNLRPSDDVTIFASRIRNTQSCSIKTLPQMAPHISDAAALLVPEGRLDVVAYACTSGTIAMGYDTVCERIHAVRPGAKVVTPITASLAALDGLGTHKLAVLTPYTDDVNQIIAHHLTAHHKEICAFTSFHIDDNEVMAALPPDAIYQAALEADRPEAEALFISCTAIRAVDVVEQIENAIRKPVVTANQAMIWQALRLAGCAAPIAGYGRLLHHATPW